MASLTCDARGVIVSCPSCGRANRLAFEALDKTTRCGHCKHALPAPAAPVDVPDTASFDAAARASTLPLIVDFWAAWCGPCRMVAPELERLAQTQAGTYLVMKVDTEQQQELAARFRIQSIPTLAVVFRGAERGRQSGARSAQDILAFADRAVASDRREAS
jgi:thioredoxin 2